MGSLKATACPLIAPLIVLITLHVFANFSAQASSLHDALAYAKSNQNEFNKQLLDFISVPSISSLPEHKGDIEDAAKWLKARLESAGLKNAQILPTEGPHPVVFAEWTEANGQPTVLIYGHYDVQPVDPLSLWETEPFKPVLEGGYFRGRGADDDKGGLLSAVQGLASWLQTSGSLPVNVKVLFEGQEEIGSPNLAAFLKKHAALVKADYALSADGGQISETESSITIGLRGALGVEITQQTVAVDLHSGLKGGSVANPIHTLTELVAGFHDADGRIAIEGFYDGVRDVSPEDEADMKAFDNVLNSEEDLKSVGAKGPFGEKGFSTTARTWLRPTLEAVGIWGGFSGEGIKTIVPSKASVKLAARLVPDQSPEAVLQAIVRHVDKHSSPLANVTVNKLGYFAHPFHMERDTLMNTAAAKVLEDVMGKKPYFVRNGGTIPAAALIQQILGIDFTMFAFGLPDDNLHSPNERFPLSMYVKGIEANIKLLAELGSLAAAANKDEL